MNNSIKKYVLPIGMALALLGCSGVPVTHTVGPENDKTQREIDAAGKLGGGDGLLNELIRGKDNGGGQGIGVNAYLWQATLDTLSFMPLSRADSFGGVVITDWYSPSDQIKSRYKVNVYILGRELRADAIKVASFKQKHADNRWQDIPANTAVNSELEDTILTRARQMRIDASAVQE